jgi:hypothetical protein
MLFIGQLCDHSCNALFDATTITIKLQDTIILQGQQSEITKLWMLDLPQSTNQSRATPVANAMAHTTHIAA